MTTAAPYWQREVATGFTLIELIVVLLSMSALMAVVAPRVSGRSENAVLQAAATDFQTLASAARAKAVLLQRPISLMIDQNERRIQLMTLQLPEDEDTSRRTRSLATGEFISRPRDISQGLSAVFMENGQSNDRVSFFHDGSAEQATLIISNSRKEELRLELVASTGRLRLAE